ncbi:hypothetical protein BGZ70_003708 [Mortierella alpina]|uniref:L-lactate dehydrogenase n=1 Tax=Mortierella alpina TaxID=64518 RepID=A0A9P6JAC7_MORAP|nr:hypothetical protein BGZ70_003708 [Mortierella alpina]
MTPQASQAPKVAIIGAGIVGSAVAFACLMRSVASDFLIYDIDTSVAHGQVLDLEDATFISSATIASAAYPSSPGYSTTTATAQDCGQADIIVMTAGHRQAPGESRDELLHRNELILRDVLTKIAPIKSTAILLMVANPVNILTCLAQKLSGLPPSQKTFLTSSNGDLGVAENCVNALVVGDHGDKQVAVWSSATVAGQPLTTFAEFEQMNTQAEIASATTNRIYDIIEHKGASAYGIAAVVSELILAILANKRIVVPLTVYSDRYDACLSLPVMLGSRGVGQIFYPQMSTKEEQSLQEYVKANQAICERYQHIRGTNSTEYEE